MVRVFTQWHGKRNWWLRLYDKPGIVGGPYKSRADAEEYAEDNGYQVMAAPR